MACPYNPCADTAVQRTVAAVYDRRIESSSTSALTERRYRLGTPGTAVLRREIHAAQEGLEARVGAHWVPVRSYT